ncbi:MAG TPA: hypothetical protein VGO09_02125 [Flavisolibacter sp.]|nr:hypothetical protein [Flavisolibacter sp.]
MRKQTFHLIDVRFLVLLLISVCSFSCSKSANKDTTTIPKGPINNALVAHWKQSYVSTIEISNPNGSGTGRQNSAEEVDFILKADGSYTQSYYNHTALGCDIMILGTKTGYWHVGTEDGGTLYLEEVTSHEKATDACNRSLDFDKDVTLKKIKYIYRVAPDQYNKPELTLQTTTGPDTIFSIISCNQLVLKQII